MKLSLTLSLLLILFAGETFSETYEEDLEDSTEDFVYLICKQNSQIVENIFKARFAGKPMSEMVDLLRENRKKNISDNPQLRALVDEWLEEIIQVIGIIYSLPKPKNEEERVNLIEKERDGAYRGCIKRLLNITRGQAGK